jgi:Ca2+-binding RTX toxin-like protein
MRISMPLPPGPIRVELPSTPPGPDPWEQEIAFISGLTANATVAAISYGSWSAAGAADSPTYHPTLSDAIKWGDTTLSPSGTPGGGVSYWFDAASDWNDVEESMWFSAMNLWSAEVNIVAEADASSTDFTIYRQPHQPSTQGGTYASFPGLEPSTIGSNVDGSPGDGAFITIGNDTVALDGSFETGGGDGYYALVHELGHMLGLGHGGPYNGMAESDKHQFTLYDTELWAIMSYIKPWDQSALYFNDYPDELKHTDWGPSLFPTTPMILDILAAQRIYGRAISGPLADGNDVFGFNSNIDESSDPDHSIGRYFDFTVNTDPVITIWDGGVNNTLDLSGWSTPSTINLNPGTFSSANGQTNNIGIALGTVIETAKGGEGSDTIIGNVYANFLFGNDGDDALFGHDGGDSLNGGPGSDAVTGGLGADLFLLAAISDGVDSFLDFSRIQQDRIALDHAGFDLGGTGTLAAVGVSLVNGATAQTSEPTLLYSGGDLSWDPDGTGASAPALLAHVLGADAQTVAAHPDAPGPMMVSSTTHALTQLTLDDFVIV